MRYIGIDPGTKGALCFLDPSVPNPLFISLDPNGHNAQAIFLTLQIELKRGPILAAIEDIHSLPGMSAKSNFTFGGMYWRIRTILDCLDLRYELVQPKVWQKAVGAPTRKFLNGEMDLKVAVADLAEGYYPTAQLYGPRGGLMDGRSDALMIAHYLKLKHGGQHA
jgi:hypothetical protein